MATKLKAGAKCYLREDYDQNSTSGIFNIPCEIIELIQRVVTSEENNLKKSSGFVVMIQKDGSDKTETVQSSDLKLQED